ncbi:MAG: hypothetical protein Pg6A_20400 [Termitinemataceae bacterium]|nr:MAG: hypothetical protein Pg6A_20400 [Termitinemataceae bacterium]
MKEVALSLNDRGIFYCKKKDYDKAVIDYTVAIEMKNPAATKF